MYHNDMFWLFDRHKSFIVGTEFLWSLYRPTRLEKLTSAVERLASLGIMWEKLRTLLNPSIRYSAVMYVRRGIFTVAFNCSPLMLRDTSLSARYKSDMCCFLYPLTTQTSTCTEAFCIHAAKSTFLFLLNQTKSDCIYYIPIDLETNCI